jgi:threonyl-tRNA synthetase
MEIRSFCVTLVFDSFNRAVISRIPEICSVLKQFVFVLAKEELRQQFVGREAYKIINLKNKLKHQTAIVPQKAFGDLQQDPVSPFIKSGRSRLNSQAVTLNSKPALQN